MATTGAFVPCPWITFFIDRPNIKCSLCLETDLELRSPMEPPGDHTPALLPCGHVFGYHCLSIWRRQSGNRSCPACRTSFEYPLCQHPVPAKLLDAVSVFTLPPTLAEEAGCIPDECHDCRWKTSRKLFESNVDFHKADFDRLRADFSESPGGRAKEALLRKKKMLQMTMQAFFSREVLHGW